MSTTKTALAATLVAAGTFTANAADSFVSGLDEAQAGTMLTELGATAGTIDLRKAVEQGAQAGLEVPTLVAIELHDADFPSPL